MSIEDYNSATELLNNIKKCEEKLFFLNKFFPKEKECEQSLTDMMKEKKEIEKELYFYKKKFEEL